MTVEDDKRRTAELPACGSAGHVASRSRVLHPVQSVNYAHVLGKDGEPLRAALALFDTDGDGEVCPAELIAAYQAYERMKAEKVLFRKLLIAAVVLCFVMVGATVGLTAAVVITTKESRVSSSGLLRANDGSETPVRTADRRGTVTVTPGASGARLASRSLLQGASQYPVVATTECATASSWFEDIANEGFSVDIVILGAGSEALESISCRATAASPPHTIDAYDQARPSETYRIDCSGVDLSAGGAGCTCPIYLTGTATVVDSTTDTRRKLAERSDGSGVSAGEVLAAAARHLGVEDELSVVGSVLREQGVAMARSARLGVSTRHLVQVRTTAGRSVAAQTTVSGGVRTDDGWHLAEWSAHGSRGALVCPPAVGDAHEEAGDCHVLQRGALRRSLLGTASGEGTRHLPRDLGGSQCKRIDSWHICDEDPDCTWYGGRDSGRCAIRCFAATPHSPPSAATTSASETPASGSAWPSCPRTAAWRSRG